MRTNKVSQNYFASYQPAFQKRLIGGKVPKPIADTIKHATNLEAIEQQFAIRFEKDPEEDYPNIGRIILFLFIQKLQPYKSRLGRVLNRIHTPVENKIYKKPIVAKNDEGICQEIQRLTVQDIEDVIKEEDKRADLSRKWGLE